MGVFRAALLLGIYCVCGPGASRCVLYLPLRQPSISASVVLHFKLAFFISIMSCSIIHVLHARMVPSPAGRPRRAQHMRGMGAWQVDLPYPAVSKIRVDTRNSETKIMSAFGRPIRPASVACRVAEPRADPRRRLKKSWRPGPPLSPLVPPGKHERRPKQRAGARKTSSVSRGTC